MSTAILRQAPGLRFAPTGVSAAVAETAARPTGLVLDMTTGSVELGATAAPVPHEGHLTAVQAGLAHEEATQGLDDGCSKIVLQ